MNDTPSTMQSATNVHYLQAIVDRERTNRALVRWWLYLICLLVFAMVMVGGATRLTDSGLSITEWKPIHGIIPPLSAGEWQEELEKYRQIPEYQLQNKGMSMAEFQFIYWWEWGHRFLGRIIGFAFAIPLAFFWLTNRLEKRLKPRLLFLLFLGGLQGFIGWWMVKSGLVDRVDVSQYRLAIHLTLACIIFAYALWVARGLASYSTHIAPPRILGAFAMLATLMVLFQIFLGGLVAGLDAGLTYNEWPLMGGQLVPDGLGFLEPLWRNWFENPVSVQFNHRISAYLLFVLIVAQWWIARRSSAEAPHKLRTVLMLLVVTAQVIIGIVTLVLQVPLHWALVHQAMAVLLLALAVAHWRGIIGPYPPVTDIEVRR